MHRYSFWFFIKQSLNGLFKNALMSLTSVFILMSCLILMGCFSLFIYNVNENLKGINTLNNIVVFADKDCTEERIDEIKAEILSLENTKSLEYISKNESLDIFIQSKVSDDSKEFYNSLKEEESFVRDKFVIEYKNVDNIDTYIYNLQNIGDDIEIKNKVEDAVKLKDMIRYVTIILVWFLAILFVVAIFIILNTIKLSVHARKNEITFMRYIGATNPFIVLPFLLEGMIIGVLSAMTAYFIQWYIYGIVIRGLDNFSFELEIVSFGNVGMILFMSFLGVGVLSGLIGSGISTRKYLDA